MESLHYLLMKAHTTLNRKIVAGVGELGLTSGQPKVLDYLNRFGERDQKTIAAYCEIEPATVGSILTRMEAAGLLDGAPCWQTWLGAPLPAAPASPETAAGALAYTAPGGLRGLQVYDGAGQLALFWTPGGVPVYLNLERYDQPLTDPVSPGKLSAYLAFAGLEEFEDWQALDWSARLPDAGEAAYSPEAQLYATANTRAGLLLSLTSLSPEQAEALG